MGVVIFSTPNCKYCKEAKSFFNEYGVPFEEHDVVAEPEQRKVMIEKSGQMGVPVILIENETIVGYNVPKMRKALGI